MKRTTIACLGFLSLLRAESSAAKVVDFDIVTQGPEALATYRRFLSQ